MAREPERKGGIFGGRTRLREDLRDISGDEKVGFADTWLGDVLGFDGKVGTQGPGLRESWRGGRRGAAPNREEVIREYSAARQREFEAERELREALSTNIYRTSGGDGLRNPNPVMDLTATGPTRNNESYYRESGGDGLRSPTRVVSDEKPSVMTDGPTIGTPEVPGGDTGVTRPPLVERPEYGGYVGFGVSEPDTAPTIETATSYPMAAKVAQLLGPKNPYVLNKLPEVLNTQLQVGGYNNINDLVRRIQDLPESQTQQEVLNELYIMRDKLRGF